MEQVKFKDVFNALCTKNQLLSVDKEVLLQIYLKNEDGILDLFIKSLEFLMKTDEVFFYLQDDIINKTLYIIGDIKEKYKEYTNIINPVLVKLNSIKAMKIEERTLKIVNYIEYESNLRKTYLDLEEFLNCINYDAIVAYYLCGNEDVVLDDKVLVLSSLNYLISLYPEIFKDEVVNNRVNSLFNEINECSILKLGLRSWLNIRSYNKETKKEYEKLVG